MKTPVRPTGEHRQSGGILSIAASFLSLLLLIAAPTPILARQVGEPPPQRLRDLAEVQLLGGRTGDGGFTPSLRVTVNRRLSLGRTLSLSGLFLQDELSHTVGLTAGGGLSFPLGSLALEPFGEIGGGMTDARISSGTYTVADGSGGSVVERFRPVDGGAIVGGAGVSVAGLLADRTAARVTIGYWRVLGFQGLARGSLRLGVSVGLGRRDERWYALATDRTAPSLMVQGRHPVMEDSVEVEDGALLILASDANGVSRIVVGGRDVEVTRADRPSLQRWGLPEGSVVGLVDVDPPFGGTRLEVLVRDSAGLTSRSAVRAFPPPDLGPPVATAIEADPPDPDPWAIEAIAHDFSGIAYARVGMCRLTLGYPVPAANMGPWGTTARSLNGWGAFDEIATVIITDRSGNEAQIGIPTRRPAVVASAPAPELGTMTLSATSDGRPGRRTLFVQGSAVDPAGGWIVRITVDDRSAPLRVAQTPSHVDFAGWTTVRDDVTEVTVVVTTADGRSARRSVTLDSLERPVDGRLFVVAAVPDGAESEALTRLAALTTPERRTVLIGADATPNALVRALVDLRGRVLHGDVVLLHLDATLAADSGAVAPSLVLSAGEIPLPYLDRLVRALEPAVALSSSHIAPGYTWQAPLPVGPGGPNPPGCIESSDLPEGRVVDLGAVPVETLLAALSGDADRDADGAVSIAELLAQVGIAAEDGLLPFDPHLTTITLGGSR